MIEPLEGRDLPSITTAALPSPGGSLVQHPADNPVLPASFDSFSPIFGNPAIPSQAPQLATLTDQGGPDDSLAVTGYQFSALSGASANTDTVFHVFGQTNSRNATLSDAMIQRVESDRAVITLDSRLPTDSMYLVWAQNAAGVSQPFAVNRTEAWWVGPDVAAPGTTTSIYGKNLSSGTITPQSWIYLQPSQGQGRWITPTSVNPYKIDFIVPAELAAGSYQLWVHNGNGGRYGWSSPVNLTVQAATDYSHLVVNLSDFGGVPNSGIDATPAFLRAIQYIGNNGPATIRLQAGQYHLSGAPLSITGGYGRGIKLEGAGKNATVIRALQGFSSQYFLQIGANGALSGLTVDATGAQLSTGYVTTACAYVSDVAIISPGNGSIKGDNRSYISITNSDFVGRGMYFTSSTQIFISGCNFYATDRTDSLVYVWSGGEISMTNCTAQDFAVDSSNPADHGKGRFFTGSGIWGTQSNVYLGDNQTIRFAPPLTYGDQNTGEQFMWEGNQGTLSAMVTSATSSSATLTNLNGNYAASHEAVIVGGKGIGQHRTITTTNLASGGTTFNIDRPWDVIPDATSRINIVTTNKQIVIYRNTLQGNSNFNGASAGIEFFQGAYDYVVDSNTLSDFQWGMVDFAYADTSGSTVQPLFSSLVQNNVITNSTYGIRSVDFGGTNGEDATHLGNIYRNNDLRGIHRAGWYIAGVGGKSMSLAIFEHNSVTDAPTAVFMVEPVTQGTTYLTIYKNLFDRGTAPASAKPIDSKAGYVELLRSNTFLNYLSVPNTVGLVFLPDTESFDYKTPSNLDAIASSISHSDESYAYVIRQSFNKYLSRNLDAASMAYWLSEMRAGRATDAILEGRLIGSADYIAAHGGPGAPWVSSMFQDLLGRAPTPTEVTSWVAQLTAGISTTTIATWFAAGTERSGNIVRQTFLQFFGRPATQTEVDLWVNVLANRGVSRQTMAAWLVGSKEFFGSTSMAAGFYRTWVDHVFRVLLHRPTSAVEQDTILKNLSLPTNLAKVAAEITQSAESYMLFITQAYKKYLGRGPDAVGLDHWLKAMQSGKTTDERLEAQFIGSFEYIANHGGSGAGWLVGMYQNLLGRNPGSSEVVFWVGKLYAGFSTEIIALSFAASRERAASRVALNYQIYLGRNPNGVEVDYWVDQFIYGGMTSELMAAGFIGAKEYFHNPAKGRGNVVHWLDAAFRDAYYRNITDAEVLALIPYLG